MTTKNTLIDGDPKQDQTWARCARSPHGGDYGVAFGCGPMQIGFIREDNLEHFYVAAQRVDHEDGAEYLDLVRGAAAGLADFKSLDKASTAEVN